MGQKEGMEREQVIACTAGSNMLCATGQKTASIYTRGVVDGNISDVLTADPCLTPVCRVLLHTGYSTIECVLSHPPSLFGKPRRMVAQQSRHESFQA